MKIGLQSKLIITFIFIALVILFLNNLLIYWETRRALENELGLSLRAVAAAAASQIDGAGILTLKKGYENTRTYKNNLNKLKRLTSNTGVKRIYIFNDQMINIIDSNEYYNIGERLYNLKFYQTEISMVFDGKTTSSVLFKGKDEKLYKTGYAPIMFGDKVVAAVGVEASANFLESIEGLKKKMTVLGIICILLAAGAAVFFSRTIVKPLKKLVGYAREIGKGNFYSNIDTSRKDEIGFLSRTMEEMKTNIIKRDTQLKMMLASVAHEIRNPLGGIELFAGLIDNGLTEVDEKKQQVKKIITEVRKLKDIINDFLEYAKPALPDKKSCLVSNILEEIKPFIEKEMLKNNVYLKLYNTSQERYTTFDSSHLRQIFINLIKNSIQAMPNGGTILIEEKCENEKIVLKIADEGEEIPENIKEKIFDPFVTTREKGTGLGLAIVKKLLEVNGGGISLSEDKDEKLKFILTLPLSG